MSSDEEPTRTWDTFSKRRKRQSGAADPFQYGELPVRLRAQIIYILRDLIESPVHVQESYGAWEMIKREVGRELGKFDFNAHNNTKTELEYWFTQDVPFEDAMDFLTVALQIAVFIANEHETRFGDTLGTKSASDALAELNVRFIEAGVGFQFVDGHFLEISSEMIHADVVLPVLRLLDQVEFQAANDEFFDAHRKLREGDFEACITGCCKSFESVLKVICEKRHWTVGSSKTTAKPLLDTVFENGLIPEYLTAEFQSLRALLEGGVPTVANKTARHGAGRQKRVTPRHLAAFQVHQTASAILLLVQADAALG